MSWRVSLPMLFGMIVCAIPLCLFAAAFEIALAMNAKTFKEAQTMMSFALLLPMMPAIIVPMLDLNTAWWMYALPVLSNQTLLMEVAKGQAVGPLPYLLTIGQFAARRDACRDLCRLALAQRKICVGCLIGRASPYCLSYIYPGRESR